MSASISQKNGKLFSLQHGANIGIYAFSIQEELEKKYCHFDDKNKMFMNEFSKSPWPNAKEKTISYLNSLGKSRNIDWTKMWGKEWLDKLA